MICAHSLFRLTTITSVFLLFNPYPFLLLSSSVMSNNCGKSSLFSAINTASSAYLMLLTLCPPILIPRYPSMLLKSFHCRERKGLEQAHILVRHRTLFFFFFLMSSFTHQLTLLLSHIISCFIFNWSCPWTSHRLAEGKIPSFLFLRVGSELPPNISHAFFTSNLSKYYKFELILKHSKICTFYKHTFNFYTACCSHSFFALQ